MSDLLFMRSETFKVFFETHLGKCEKITKSSCLNLQKLHRQIYLTLKIPGAKIEMEIIL